MGGSAFSPALHTPRMPPEVYWHVRDEVHRKLASHYSHVSTPIEAPAKVDYGDIDVLVYEDSASWKGPGAETLEEQLVSLLGAKAYKGDKGSEELHFALPWPEDFTSPLTNQDLSQSLEKTKPETNKDSDLPQPNFIQLDLHICPSLNVYAWHAFRCGHGDFWIIVGSVIRRYGLSFRNSGLFVRVAEVEKVNKKLSLVKLSSEPEEVLNFLFNEGAEERFWKNDAFASVKDMCDFIRLQCKFYRPLKEREVLDEAGDDAEAPAQKKDRSRMKRGSFRYWVKEYLPKYSTEDRETDFKGEYAEMKREEVAEIVKERFKVIKEYEGNQRIGLRQVGIEDLWNDIRSIIPPPERTVGGVHGVQGPDSEVNFVLRTLRRKVIKEAIEKKDEELDEVQLAYREGRFEEVKTWAEGNWKEIAKRKMAENEEKSHINYEAKLESVERDRQE